MFKNAIMIALLAVIAVGGTSTTAGAQDNTEATVEVRAWQGVGDLEDIRISARPSGGLWSTLGTIPLPLDDGVSSSGRYEYGDIDIPVPLPNYAVPAIVEVRIWQDTRQRERLYISARPAGGSWETLGTIPLPMDDGVSSSGRFRYEDVVLAVPLDELGVTTLAGRAGQWGYRDGAGSQALFGRKYLPLVWCFARPYLGIEFDRDGSVVVADRENNAIRRITPDGTVTTIAGGKRGTQDGPAETAEFTGPTDVAIASDGSIYVADRGSHLIRKISPDGMVSTVAGTGESYLHREAPFADGPALEATFSWPSHLAFDPDSGDLYIAELNHHVRRLSTAGWVSTFAGASPYSGGDWPDEHLTPKALDVGSDGRVYVLGPSDLRVFDPDGTGTTLMEFEQPGLGGAVADPNGLVVGPDGEVYISSMCHHQVLVITPDGELRAMAGTGERGYADGPAGSALFDHPSHLAISDDGALAVADEGNNIIRILEADPFGTQGLRLARGAVPEELPGLAQATVVAGDPRRYGYGFEDGIGEEALFRTPREMAFDRSGNVVVVDWENHAVRSIAPDGLVTTIAGSNDRGATDGDCADAQFAYPTGVAVSADGDIYIADSGNDRIRRITRGRGICQVTTVVGQERGYRDGPAAVARLDDPTGLAFDRTGSLIIAESGGHRIRRFSPSDGSVSTVAGKEFREPFTRPRAVATDGDGNIYFTQENAIYRIDAAGNLTVVVRTPVYVDNWGMLESLTGIAVTEDGTLYVTEAQFDRLLRITSDGVVASIVVNTDSGRFSPNGILLAPNGDILVSDAESDVIRRITLP